MVFFSSRIKLNNEIKLLKSEVEKLKSETIDKSEKISKLNKEISDLSRKNAEYEKKYKNTNLECDFCYTTIQKEFSFCPKCGKRIEKRAEMAPIQEKTDIFKTEDDGGYALITQYNGFNDKRIVIPSSINGKPVIGVWNDVFKKCTDLEEVIFEEGCKYIANDAFARCSNLKKVKLPKSLLEIGNRAFIDTGIEEIGIPPLVKTIGDGAFSGCKNLKSILLPPNLVGISYGMLELTALTEIDIPDSVRHIDQYAFAYTKIEKLELPKNLYSIDSHAFDISSLREITIHGNVETIHKDAFGKECPVINCGAGTKAHLFARKHSMNCKEIQTNTNAVTPYANAVEMELGYFNRQIGIPAVKWYCCIGLDKAASWSWKAGRLGDNMSVTINKIMTMDEAEKIRQSFQNYADRRRNWCIIQSLSINQYWGQSDV